MADDMMKTLAGGHDEAEDIEDHGGKLLAEISILFQRLTGGCEERHKGQLLRELPPFSIRLPLLWWRWTTRREAAGKLTVLLENISVTKDHFDNQFDDNYTVKADVLY